MRRVWAVGFGLACNTPEGGPCPANMVLIPAETVTVGFPPPLQAWMEPTRTVAVAAYCIDRYEWPNRAGEVPQADLTWDAADAACRSVGKRLCSSVEWERACRGREGARFSYGRQRDSQRCNTPIEGSGPGTLPAPVAASGAFSGCRSAEGVYDLNGNLSEWVSDPWTGPPEPFSPDATVDPNWFTLRGGTMWNRTFYGQDCSSRHGHHRSFQNMDDGARCCQDARLSTGTLGR